MPPETDAPWTTPWMIFGTYMAMMKTTTEIPAMAKVVTNWSEDAVGALARPKRTCDPILAIITKAMSFMPTPKA